MVKIAPEAADDPLVSPDARERGRALARAAPMRALSRMWQMLLVAIEEAGRAPSAAVAAEMAVIRLTHVADLPSPEELVRRLQEAAPHETAARPSGSGEAAPRRSEETAPRGGASGEGGRAAERPADSRSPARAARPERRGGAPVQRPAGRRPGCRDRGGRRLRPARGPDAGPPGGGAGCRAGPGGDRPRGAPRAVPRWPARAGPRCRRAGSRATPASTTWWR